MTEEDFQNILSEILYDQDYNDDREEFMDVSIRTFEENRLLTYNKGLIITLQDGSKFQLTIVRVE